MSQMSQNSICNEMSLSQNVSVTKSLCNEMSCNEMSCNELSPSWNVAVTKCRWTGFFFRRSLSQSSNRT